jgi:hypothetical protein
MSAKDFHESRNNASGAKMDGTQEEIDLNVGSSVTPSTPRAVSSAPRPAEGAVRTTGDGFRQVFRKIGGWAGELEEHPNDGENRIHLNGFSRKIDELSPAEIQTAKTQQEERAKGFSAREIKASGQSGSVIDLDQRAGSAPRSAGETPGKPKANMIFDALKGRLVKAGVAPQPKEQSYIDRLASRHPSPGVSAGEGIPAYDRHPKEIRTVLNNHIKLVGDFLSKAKANQGAFTDEFGGKQIGFAPDHPLAEQADLAMTHHLMADRLQNEARDMYSTNVPQAHHLIRQAAMSIHKATQIINQPEFALAAGGWPDASLNPTETKNNLSHAVVELESPRVSKLPKGVKLHDQLLSTADEGNQALVRAFAKRVAEGKHPGVDRNLAHAVVRFWKRGTPLGSEGWKSGEDVTPTGFKGDVLVNTVAATAETGTNPLRGVKQGSAADNLAPSSPSAPRRRRQRAPAAAKPEETTTKTGRRSTPPTTKRGKAAKETRTQNAIDKVANDAVGEQLSGLAAETGGVNTVRAEKSKERKTRTPRGNVFVKDPVTGKTTLLTGEQPKPVRLKKKTAAEIIAERRGN